MLYMREMLIMTFLLLSEQSKAQSDVAVYKGNISDAACITKGENLTRYFYGVHFGAGAFTTDAGYVENCSIHQGGLFACARKGARSEDMYHSNKTFAISTARGDNGIKVNSIMIAGEQNATLFCRTNLTGSYALLWIAENPDGSMRCLSSVEVERDLYSPHNVTYNGLCGSVKSSHPPSQSSTHLRDIWNITSGDRGKYSCIIFNLKAKCPTWETINITSLDTTVNDTWNLTSGTTSPETGGRINTWNLTSGTTSPETGDRISHTNYIVPGVVGGLAAAVLVLLIIIIMKTKGKKRNGRSSQPNAVNLADESDCMPYAVCERPRDIQTAKSAAEAEYTEIMERHYVLNPEYSGMDDSPSDNDSCAVAYSVVPLKK